MRLPTSSPTAPAALCSRRGSLGEDYRRDGYADDKYYEREYEHGMCILD